MRATELGEFLKSRRARVDPTDKGFSQGRRRTAGLRREELASLAGVTASWLTKLEQGRANAVSSEVLDALARALQLSEAERAHLLGLAGYRVEATAGEGEVTASLRKLIDDLEPNPAYLLDRCWNIVAWNAAEARLFPRLQAWTGDPPNLLKLVFLDSELAELMADHDEEVVRLVAQFRLHCADWPNDGGVASLLDELRAASPRFATTWDAKDVRPFSTTRRVFHHPTAGRVELDHHRLAVLDQPGMQLVVYTSPTRAAL